MTDPSAVRTRVRVMREVTGRLAALGAVGEALGAAACAARAGPDEAGTGGDVVVQAVAARTRTRPPGGSTAVKCANLAPMAAATADSRLTRLVNFLTRRRTSSRARAALEHWVRVTASGSPVILCDGIDALLRSVRITIAPRVSSGGEYAGGEALFFHRTSLPVRRARISGAVRPSYRLPGLGGRDDRQGYTSRRIPTPRPAPSTVPARSPAGQRKATSASACEPGLNVGCGMALPASRRVLQRPVAGEHHRLPGPQHRNNPPGVGRARGRGTEPPPEGAGICASCRRSRPGAGAGRLHGDRARHERRRPAGGALAPACASPGGGPLDGCELAVPH